MEKVDIGLEIYSITIGVDPKDAMKWSVGQTLRLTKDKVAHTVSKIYLDEEWAERFDVASYIICVQDPDGHEYVWRRCTNVPCIIVYEQDKL